MYKYNLFTLLYPWNKYNMVNQLYSQAIKKNKESA